MEYVKVYGLKNKAWDYMRGGYGWNRYNWFKPVEIKEAVLKVDFRFFHFVSPGVSLCGLMTYALPQSRTKAGTKVLKGLLIQHLLFMSCQQSNNQTNIY